MLLTPPEMLPVLDVEASPVPEVISPEVGRTSSSIA